MPAPYTLSLLPACRVSVDEQGIRVVKGNRVVQFDASLRAYAPLLARLERGTRQADLDALFDTPAALPWMYLILARLQDVGMLCHGIERDGQAWLSLGALTAAPIMPATGDLASDLASPTRWRLAPFAYLRHEQGVWQLLCPAVTAFAALPAPSALLLIHALGELRTLAELAAHSTLPVALVRDGIQLLAGGALVEAEEASAAAPPAYRLWEFHDLLFHWNSRLGHAERPYGGTYSHPDGMEPLSAIKPPGDGALVRLDATNPASGSASLHTVMTRRRSVRAHGAHAIDLALLGQFLYRCARHIATIPTDRGELAVRPYPAGGAMHELELYLVVDRCQGLAPGLYHYRGADHALETLSAANAATAAMLESASATLAGAGRPQILIVLGARFQRLSWKYRAVVYALVLKHVGVLYQTFYLVATDMGLAPCAMGGGDSDLFARATGIDPMLESSVGEFALGTVKETGDDVATLSA